MSNDFFEDGSTVEVRGENRATSTGPGWGIIFVMLIIAGISLLLLANHEKGISVSREELGKSWPFYVEGGHLTCDPPNVVLFHAQNQTYGLTEAALALGHQSPSAIRMRVATGQPASMQQLIERGYEACY